jgi:P4 family phage/plasmid primase-like protien
MSVESMNKGADGWYYDKGVNVIPADTKNKKPLYNWKQYQENSASQEIFEQWKKEGAFDKGIAIIPGKSWRGTNKGKYLIVIDIDNEKGLKEFLTKNGKETTIEEFASKTLVEQRRDDTKRAHLFFISPIPFPSKGTDSKIGIEVKREGNHGLIFVSPSIHKNGYPYEIIGTKNIVNLNHKQALELRRRINDICVKNGLKYLENKENSRLTPQIRKMINTLNVDTAIVISEGERHMTLLSLANSLLVIQHILNNKPLDELKDFFDNVNSILCKPYPLPQNEIDHIWESAVDFVEKKKEHYKNKNKLKKKDILIEEATEQILSSHYFVTIEESKEILYYNNGVYEEGGELIIEKELETHYGYQLNINDVKEIKAHIIRKTYVRSEEFDRDLNIINMKNGLYLINENMLIPHNPQYYSLNQKPIVYNPKAQPKDFIKFLKEVLYIEDILTVIDILAYTFLRHNPFEYYFILLGLGANGKSVLMGVLTKLHGRRNVSNVSLSSILTNRFALAGIDGKDVNIDTELSSSIIKDMSILKKLTGQQPIAVERKNVQPDDTILHAKLFFNANAIPLTIDYTDAHYRREIIISFPNQFEEGKNADPNLLSKLTKEEELSGIFNILMKGLRRILKNDRVYLNQKTIQERRERHELILDPLTAFRKAAIAEDSIESDYETKDDLHVAYVKFCKFHHLPYESNENLGKILKKPPHNFTEGRESRKDKNGKRNTIWTGIKLIDWVNTDPQQGILIWGENYTN